MVSGVTLGVIARSRTCGMMSTGHGVVDRPRDDSQPRLDRPRKRTIQYSEALAIDRISRSVLDTRLRGYDGGGWGKLFLRRSENDPRGRPASKAVTRSPPRRQASGRCPAAATGDGRHPGSWSAPHPLLEGAGPG